MSRLFIIAGLVVLMFTLSGCGGKSRDELYTEGVKLLQEGNPGGAVVLFKSSLEKDQNFQDARYQLAKAYQALGKYEQAEKEYLKVLKQNPSKTDIVLELAKLYNSQRKPDQAVEQAGKYLQSNPGSAEALEVLGLGYALKGMPAEAERNFLLALEKEPRRTSTKLQLAVLLMEQKSSREKEARALIDEILTADPGNVKAHNLLAGYELSLGNREQALEIYRKVAALTPGDPAPLYRQGVILLEKGEMDKAEKTAETLVQKFPQKSEGARLKGLIAYQRKNYADAITALQTSVKIAPSLEGLYYLGLSMYSRGELENALSQFRRILDHTPDFVQARLLTALILLNQKRVDDAIAEANRAIETDSRSALARNILGSAYLAKGMYDEGIRELNRATELDPKIVDAHLKKGIFNLSKGRVREAESDFTTAVRVAPEMLNSRLVLAFHYMRQHRSDRALATLKEGLTGTKGDASLYNTMAAIMFNERKPAEAVKYLNMARKSDPAFLPARFNLATYHASTGDLDGAIAEYSRMVQEDPHNLRAILGLASLSELKGRESDALAWYTKARDTGEYAGYLALAGYHEKKGNLDKALAVLDDAVKAKPRAAEAFVMKGRILLAQKKGKDAIRVFTDLESIAPEQGLALKVAAFVQMKESAKAIEEARRAVTLKPDAAFGHSILASVYAEQGDLPRAIQEVKAGLRAEPGNVGAAMQLGEYLGRNGNTAAAMAQYEAVLRNNPNHAPALFAQGMLLEMGGKKREAVTKYRQTLEKAESFAPALNNLAFLYAEGYGPREEALRMALTALKQEPANAAIADTYGYALVKNGRAGEAVKILEKVVKLMPSNPAVRYHLALAYRDTGDRARAATTLQEALKQGDFPESGQARIMLAELSGAGETVKKGKY